MANGPNEEFLSVHPILFCAIDVYIVYRKSSVNYKLKKVWLNFATRASKVQSVEILANTGDPRDS